MLHFEFQSLLLCFLPVNLAEQTAATVRHERKSRSHANFKLLVSGRVDAKMLARMLVVACAIGAVNGAGGGAGQAASPAQDKTRSRHRRAPLRAFKSACVVL